MWARSSANVIDNNGVNHGFLFVNGQFIQIDVPGAAQTFAFGIDDTGRIVGFYLASDGPKGYLRSADGSFTTVNVPGAADTRLRGINDSGSITGQYMDNLGTHAFVLNSGALTTIDVPGAAATFGRGINQPGDVAGNFRDAATGGTRGFVATVN